MRKGTASRLVVAATDEARQLPVGQGMEDLSPNSEGVPPKMSVQNRRKQFAKTQSTFSQTFSGESAACPQAQLVSRSQAGNRQLLRVFALCCVVLGNQKF